MSKRKDSCYRYGRSPHWLKIKNAHAPAMKREAPRRTGEDDPPRGLAQADRLIADCMDHIARQREVITTRYQQGPPTDVAESMLWALKESLRAFRSTGNTSLHSKAAKMLFAVDRTCFAMPAGFKLAKDSHDTMALPTTSAPCEQTTIRGSSPPDGDGSRSVSRGNVTRRLRRPRRFGRAGGASDHKASANLELNQSLKIARWAAHGPEFHSWSETVRGRGTHHSYLGGA
jgi:hypothetical protein